MKGKIISSLKDYSGKTVWVEFEDPNSVSCANDDDYGLGGAEAKLYSSGVYRVEGHFLVSNKDASLSFQEFTPSINAIYEWQE